MQTPRIQSPQSEKYWFLFHRCLLWVKEQMTPLTTQMALSTILSEKPGRLASRAVAFPPLDKASSVCGPAHYLSQTDTGFVLVQRQGNRWRQQVWGEVPWMWLPSLQRGLCLKEGTPGATFFSASRENKEKPGGKTAALKRSIAA